MFCCCRRLPKSATPEDKNTQDPHLSEVLTANSVPVTNQNQSLDKDKNSTSKLESGDTQKVAVVKPIEKTTNEGVAEQKNLGSGDQLESGNQSSVKEEKVDKQSIPQSESQPKREEPQRQSVKEANEEMRADAVRLAKRAIERSVPAFIIVNNRSEGHAPGTIQAIATALTESSP